MIFCQDDLHSEGTMSTSVDKAPEAFTDAFPEVKPLICAEWPDVDSTAIDQTDGDYGKVVELVCAATEQEQELVERQLAELQQVASDEEPVPAGAKGRPVHEAMRSMQGKMNEVAHYVRQQMLDDAKSKARENFLVTLLLAIGLGFVLGIIVRGFGRGRS